MMLTLVFILLFPSVVHPVVYEAKFETSQLGLTFSPNDSNDLLIVENDVSSLLYCVKLCLTNIDCLTVNFDPSTRTCFLYAAWIFEGSLVPSSSSTSKVTYIDQIPVLYSSYLQPCVSFFNTINRYLRCINSSWVCPNKYFFNGNVCEYWRSFGGQCQANQWCDSSNYFQCSSLVGKCTCNYSMAWDGSTCNTICPLGQVGITFDDVPTSNTVPAGYAGFQWSNMEVLNGTVYNNGYYLPLYNGDQVASNRDANPISVHRLNGTFTLNSLIIPPIWISTLNITITGSLMGSPSYSALFYLNTTYIWIVTLNWANIDTFNITCSPYTNASQVTIDNICITLQHTSKKKQFTISLSLLSCISDHK